jgi:tRNA threonylcarbamoyladenosine biosynthesis protein TsaE
MHQAILNLPDSNSTEAAGRIVAPLLEPGMVVGLSGDLGAGKTTFVRGVLRAMDISGPVKSPTYTLVEPYTVSSLYLYHFDFYRLQDPYEWEAAGFRDYFGAHSICLIEWPERVRGLAPPADLSIVLRIAGSGRLCMATASSERAEPCVAALARFGAALSPQLVPPLPPPSAPPVSASGSNGGASSAG